MFLCLHIQNKKSGKAAFLHAFTGFRNRAATKMQAEDCALPAKKHCFRKCLYAQMGTA
jgi:hypothetical protein